MPPHLRKERTIKFNVPPGHMPPFPAWAERFTPLTQQVVMTYLVVQADNEMTLEALSPITKRFDHR